MKTVKKYFSILIFVVLPFMLFAQDHDTLYKFEFPVEQLLSMAVHRTDFYICTGIAFAKANGHTVDDFTKFTAQKHVYAWNNRKGEGIQPVVRTLITLWKFYQNSDPEIISHSDSIVNMRFDKPYKEYFTEGYMLDVPISEFEEFLFGHIKIMMDEIGICFNYNIENESVNASISENK